MEENQKPISYDIVKLCKGGLVLNLPAFDSSVQNRRVEFRHDTLKLRVPRVFALGIFTDSTIERMYKEGYFKVEPVATFEKEIAEIFYAIDKKDKAEIIEDAAILAMLKEGNRIKIKSLIDNSNVDNVVNRDKILMIARENIDSLPSSMIRDLEKIFSVELTIENE